MDTAATYFQYVIGSMNWDACGGCTHSDDYGCNVDAGFWRDQLNQDGDFLYCGCFEEIDSSDEESDSINPNQLTLIGDPGLPLDEL
jgi:hypothetical protein